MGDAIETFWRDYVVGSGLSIIQTLLHNVNSKNA